MNRLIGWSLVLALAGASGCVSAEMRRARVVQDDLVGYTRAQLTTCAGEAQREAQKEDRKVLTYYKSCGMLEEGFPTTRGTMARAHRHGCQATVEFDGDTIRRVVFVPVPEGADDEVYHCEEMFAACMTRNGTK